MSWFRQKIGKTFQYVFQPRDHRASYSINPQLIFLVLFLGVVGLLIYMFSNSQTEIFYRYASLLLLLNASIGWLLGRKSDTAARWGMVLALSGILVFLAWWQNQPKVLNLLILPTAMSIMMINLPALFIAITLHTGIIVYAGQVFSPTLFSGMDQLISLCAIWLTGLFLGCGYFQIEHTTRVFEEDYERLQNLVLETRQQQFKLAQTLENLERANYQLSLLYDKTISLRKIAEEARESKMLFIAKVSHEIRTPLSIILGVTSCIVEDQDLFEEELPLGLLDDIYVIRRSSEHLLSLINDVLDLTRSETGKLILKKGWTDITVELKKCIEIVQPLATKKELSLILDLPDSLPSIFCDRGRIRQVVLNLLHNAIRVTDQGEVGVQVSVDPQWLTIQIWDTGPGVKPEDVEHIFEPFYQGSNDGQKETVGSGIGLSISQQLLELHEGELWLENRFKEGCSFFCKLPISPMEISTPSAASFIDENWVWFEKTDIPSSSVKIPKKRIIISDPEDILFNSAQRMGLKLDLEKVSSLPEVIHKISDMPAHLILINNNQSVPALLNDMQTVSDQLQDTPIIGCNIPSFRNRLRELGAIDFIQKPFNAARLCQAVEAGPDDARKILIADDNVDMQHLIVRHLSSQENKLEYLLASTGKEAWQVILDKRPDLILLDLALPEIDGWQLLEMKLNAASDIRQIPLIIISAHDLEDTPLVSNTLVIKKNDGFLSDDLMKYVLGSLTLS